MTKQTYGALCALAEQHGVVMTEEVRAFVRAVEQADLEAQTGDQPVAYLRQIKARKTFDILKKAPNEETFRTGWFPVYRRPSRSTAQDLSDEERDAVEVAIRVMRQFCLNNGPYYLQRIASLEGILSRAATVAEPNDTEPVTFGRLPQHEHAAILKAFKESDLPDTRDNRLAFLRGWEKVRPPEFVRHPAQPSAKWEDPRVQQVYEILCRDDAPPTGEHWESFQARLIVDALFGKETSDHAEYERAQQLEVFLRLAEVVQADAKQTRDRYPVQSERADQLAAFMKTACKWLAQASTAEAVLDYLKANAMPSFQVEVTVNAGSASLYRKEIITVAFSSWDLLIEHIRTAAQQGAAR